MPNQMDRRSFHLGRSGTVQENFNACANHLEALIADRDAQVRTALADYSAEGVSESYAGKEADWNAAAAKCRHAIATLRKTLEQNDGSAQVAMRRAQSEVDSIA